MTTTSKDNVTALLAALKPHLDADSFDVIVDLDDVSSPKPDPEAYSYALAQVGETHAVAIEDNIGGVRAATAAGLNCVAFPNQNTSGGDFAEAAETVEALDAQRILLLARA